MRKYILFFLVLTCASLHAQQLKWSSYAGGFGAESASYIATSRTGAVFLTYTTDNEDSMITPNAAFPKKSSPFSAGILCKLNPDQSIAWATYLTDDSLGSFSVRNIVYDENGYVYVVGCSIGNGFPIPDNSTFGPLQGSAEAVIAKFDSNGVFIWSRVISSNGFDAPTVAALDQNGDIWVGGYIAYPNGQPLAGIPITSNAYQSIPNPVNVPNTVDEMFIVCIAKSGSMLYSTYFGGNGFEDPADISVDGNNNIHFLVRTSSNDIAERNNPFERTIQNKFAYTISIKKSNFRVNYVAPLPIHPNDIPESLKLSKSNSIYILGKTNNLDSYSPIPESILSTGNTAIVIHAISPDFKIDKTWALNGFINNEIGARELVATDSSLLVLLYEKKNLLRTNPNAFQKLNNGLIDAFIFKLGYDFKPKWATYLGKSGDDFPSTIQHNGTTNWITGTTQSTDYYTSSNAISKQLNDGLGGTTGDIFLTAFNCTGKQNLIQKNAVTLCYGIPVTIKTRETFASYSWNNSSTSDSISISSDTTIFLQVVDTSGCIYFERQNYVFIQPPIVRSFDTTFCSERSLTLSYNASNTTGILWNTGSTRYSIEVNDSGIFKALVYNSCFSDSFDVRVQKTICEGDFYFPTAFSPNDDGINDVFDLVGENITARTLQIYNRWGQLIYNVQEGGPGWNGYYRNKPALPDVYSCLATVTDKLGRKYQFSGTLQLVR